MNTEVTYRYRTLTGETRDQSVVVEGELPADGLTRISQSLYMEEFFIPSAIGLPEQRILAWDDDADVPWFELLGCDITSREATVPMTAAELVSAFEREKVCWEELAEDIGPMSLLETALEDLYKENEENLEDPDDHYAQGYHDALLDVQKRMGMYTGNREYFD